MTGEITAYKGFNANLSCRGFRYEVGKTYEHDGRVEACSSGFHACEYPLDVFGYYAPAYARFAVVKQEGDIRRHGEDSKVASGRITIEAEINIPEMVSAAVQWINSQLDTSTPAATNTGYRSAATNTGDQSAATNTGEGSAATNTGFRSAATAGNATAVALASGREGKARGVLGSALFLVHRDSQGNIMHAWAGIVGRDGIEPDTFYSLDESGAPVKVGEDA